MSKENIKCEDGCEDCSNKEPCCHTNETVSDKMQDARIALARLNQDRQEGLKKLEDKVSDLLNSEVLNMKHMNENKDLVITLRDLVNAANANLLVIEAHDRLLNMMISDLVNLTRNVEMQSHNTFVTSSHLQTLLAILEADGLITEDKMRDTWTQIVQAKQAELKPKE